MLSGRLQGSAVLSGAIAQRFARSRSLQLSVPAVAYLAGLMCELGALACLAVDPAFSELYAQHAESPQRRFELEQARATALRPAPSGAEF